MDSYKLLLFDLDGTLLRSDKTISAHTLDALRECRRKGMLIGISTSRSGQNVLPFLKEIQPDLLITSGGALAGIPERIYLQSGIFRRRNRTDDCRRTQRMRHGL